MTEERWLPVVGYEGRYEVSDLGRVRERTGFGLVFMKPLTPLPSGHLRFSVSGMGKPRGQRYVHRAVLEAFVGPCPPGMECCHWDDDPANNRLENLRWDTPSGNARDRVRNARKRAA